MYLNILHIF